MKAVLSAPGPHRPGSAQDTVLRALSDRVPADKSRRYVRPALHIWAAWSLQIQYPHGTGPQCAVYSPPPPRHRGTDPSSLLRFSHNTARPHNASDPHQPAFSRSECRVIYHGAFHLPHRYSAHHWSQPAEYPVPCSS